MPPSKTLSNNTTSDLHIISVWKIVFRALLGTHLKAFNEGPGPSKVCMDIISTILSISTSGREPLNSATICDRASLCL